MAVLETRANPLRVPHLSLLYAEVRSFPCRTMRLESCFTVVWNGRVSHGTSTTTDLPRMWGASGFSAGSKGTAVLADFQIFRRCFTAIFRLFVAHLGALIEGAQTCSFHGRDVHKNVFAALVGLNKSIALSGVKPLHNTRRHARSPLFANRPERRSVGGWSARKTRRRKTADRQPHRRPAENAEKAMRPVDREAWLRLAADWAQLAEGAGLMERKGIRSIHANDPASSARLPLAVGRAVRRR